MIHVEDDMDSLDSSEMPRMEIFAQPPLSVAPALCSQVGVDPTVTLSLSRPLLSGWGRPDRDGRRAVRRHPGGGRKGRPAALGH